MLKDVEQVSGDEIADFYVTFLNHYGEFYTRKWMEYKISRRIVKKMQQELGKKR